MFTSALMMKILNFLTVSALLGKGLFSLKKPKIFVQIASYRDPECQHTVEDLFDKARYPKRVNVGICWQFEKDLDQKCFEVPYKYPEQVRVYEVPAKEGKGVCWARNITQSLWRGEEYTLVIDSHMRFVDYWDEVMISQLKACNSKKALLTAYPAAYTPPDKLEPNPRPTIQRPNFFDKIGDIRGKGEFLDKVPEKPLKGMFIAAGFMFSKSDVIEEVPYDPHMYFNQEEVSYALRLYTHGWDVYHPNKVMIYHYYKKPGQTEIPLHWSDNSEWSKMQSIARKRFHHMVGHKVSDSPEALEEIDKYELGTERTLEEFEKESGVDFKNLQVSEYGLRAKFIKELPLYSKNGVFIPEIDGKKIEQAILENVKNNNSQPSGQEKLLSAGDTAPDFSLPDHDRKPTEIKLYSGGKMVFMFLPTDFSEYMDEFFRYLSTKFDFFKTAEDCKLVAIVESQIKASEIKQKYNSEILFLCDENNKFYNFFVKGKNPKMYPCTVIMDEHKKILAVLDQRNAQNHVADIIRELKKPVA